MVRVVIDQDWLTSATEEGSEPVVHLEESLIKCHWNVALQHDDLSQEEAEPGR